MRITIAIVVVAIRAIITVVTACKNGMRKGIHNFRENIIQEEF